MLKVQFLFIDEWPFTILFYLTPRGENTILSDCFSDQEGLFMTCFEAYNQTILAEDEK